MNKDGMVIFTLLSYLQYSGLDPSLILMIYINSIIDFDLFSWLPLSQYSRWVNTDRLVILGRPSCIMYIYSAITYKYNLCIHPLGNGIQHIEILSYVECRDRVLILRSFHFIFYNTFVKMYRLSNQILIDLQMFVYYIFCNISVVFLSCVYMY